MVSCWLSHFQGGLEAFPSPSFSPVGNQTSPVYVLNLLGGEGNHFQLRGGNDSSSEVEMIPFASEVILFVCHPPISEITQGATLADELYPHFYLKKNIPRLKSILCRNGRAWIRTRDLLITRPAP